MENKKPVIIVPPISPSMQKLREVLEGISGDENMEILSVVDEKEFRQLIGSSGQALVMISSAKLCAMLLQENRALISKNNSKVLLLTPKEIPPKTVAKLNKIGLTEAILDTSPAKTLLHKVKLIVKSIKTSQKKEESTQQVVKSMLDLSENGMGPELSANTEAEVLVTRQESIKRDEKKLNLFDNEESKLDYLTNKKKKTYNEEAIDTHWKSKAEGELQSLDIQKEKKINEEELNQHIDTFYRGKQQQKAVELDFEKEKKKEHSEQTELDIKKAKQNFSEENETSDSPFLKLKESEDLSLFENNGKQKKKEYQETTIDFEKEKANLEAEESEDRQKSPRRDDENELIDPASGKSKNKNKFNEDLDFDDEKKKSSLDNESHDAFGDKERNEDQSLLELDEKEKRKKALAQKIDLELEKGGIFQSASEEESGKGKRSDDSDLNLFDEDQKKKSERKQGQLNLDLDHDKKKDLSANEDNTDHRRQREGDLDNFLEEGAKKQTDLHASLNLDLEKNKKESAKMEDHEDPNGHRPENTLYENHDLDLKKNKEDEISNEKNDESQLNEITSMIKMDEGDGPKMKSSDNFQDDAELKKASSKDTSLDLEAGKNKKVHEGQTEHINTHYSSGGHADKEQDWNIVDKKDSTIRLSFNEKAEENLGKLNTFKDNGEMTIDYRKLKEEFDQIAHRQNTNEEENSAKYGRKNAESQIIEDDYKVVLADTKGMIHSLKILNLYLAKDQKASDIVKYITHSILQDYGGVMALYLIKDKKPFEYFTSYHEYKDKINEKAHFHFETLMEDPKMKEHFNQYNMPTWLCRSIPKEDSFWSDIELPQWAKNELNDKIVELIYPFYDGVTKLGYAHLQFPNGIHPKDEHTIMLTIELLKGIYMENAPIKGKASTSTEKEVAEVEDNKVLNFFGSLFGKKKVG